MPQDLTAKRSEKTTSQPLSWKPAELIDSVKKLADVVEANVTEASDWYMAKRKAPSIGARWSRMLAIIFVTLGGLAPLIASTFGDFPRKVTGTGAGYLFLALAAACIALDRYAGFSSSWMRRVTTAQSIKRLVIEFRVQWPPLLAEVEAKPSVTAADVKPLFDRVAKLADDAEELIKEETRLWKVEFESAFSQLEKATQAGKAEEKKPPLSAEPEEEEKPKTLALGEQAVAGQDVAMGLKKKNGGDAAANQPPADPQPEVVT